MAAFHGYFEEGGNGIQGGSEGMPYFFAQGLSGQDFASSCFAASAWAL